MSKLARLLQVTEEEKKAILTQHNFTEEKFEENVKMLKEWIGKCEHLPKDDDDNKFRIVLVNSKMSLEKAKQCLEGYYRIRRRYSDEFFNKMTPNAKEYLEAKKYVQMAIMPKLTPNLNRISIYKTLDPNGEANDAYMYQLPALMITELRIIGDMFLSNIIIVDFELYSWKTFLKFTPVVNQKLIDILVSLNLRIYAIHFINLSNIMESMMTLVKAIMPGHIVQKIHIHDTYESLHEHVPKEYLPSNYGGTQRSLEEIYDEWCGQIDAYEELFEKLLTQKSTEKIDMDPMQRDVFGCGAEGSFRRLAVD